MSQEILQEIEERRQYVEKEDREYRIHNLENFRSYWLNLVILSSAIAVGIIPLLNDQPSIIISVLLAQIGLLVIVIVCVLLVLYLQNVLARERDLLADQRNFHEYTFGMQNDVIKSAKQEGKSAEYIICK